MWTWVYASAIQAAGSLGRRETFSGARSVQEEIKDSQRGLSVSILVCCSSRGELKLKGDKTRTMDGDLLAQAGQLDLLKSGQGKEFSTQAMDLAAANGHLEVVKWLHENRTEGCTTEAMDEAAKNGHLDVVTWLHEHRQEGCTGGAMDMAGRHGHLDVLKFLHENRSEGCSTLAVDFAAHNGHTEVVKWLFENRQEGCTPAAAEGAAGQGHDEIVQYLKGHKRGRSVDYKDLGAVLGQGKS